MKIKTLLTGVIFSISAHSYAGCVGVVVNGECKGTYIDNNNIGSSSNHNSGYTGSSGARYQYDLSNPSDSLRYSTDLEAQRRDQMNLDINRKQDRSLGQYGGGAYGD